MSNDLLDRFGSNYSENTVIFREGDVGDCMYIIQEGEVSISKKGQNSDFVLAVLKTGDFFGEMTLFTNPNRVATAKVTIESVLLKIDKSSFDYMVQKNVPFAVRMIEKLCDRLKKVDDQLSELMGIGEQTRMLQFLMNYWKIAGKKDATGQNILMQYQGFMNFLSTDHHIGEDDGKRALFDLKSRGLIHVKKDTQGIVYLTLSPRVFSYFNII
ncbi:MAG: Crp/Fnr family transcriptional regulator [Leptospirales bacterium]